MLYPDDLFPQIDVAIAGLVSETSTDKYFGTILTPDDISFPHPQREIKRGGVAPDLVQSPPPSHPNSTLPDGGEAVPASSGSGGQDPREAQTKGNAPSPLCPARDAYSRFKKVMHPFGVMAFVKYEPQGHLQK